MMPSARRLRSLSEEDAECAVCQKGGMCALVGKTVLGLGTDRKTHQRREMRRRIVAKELKGLFPDTQMKTSSRPGL